MTVHLTALVVRHGLAQSRRFAVEHSRAGPMFAGYAGGSTNSSRLGQFDAGTNRQGSETFPARAIAIYTSTIALPVRGKSNSSKDRLDIFCIRYTIQNNTGHLGLVIGPPSKGNMPEGHFIGFYSARHNFIEPRIISDNSTMNHFPRPALARALTDGLEGRAVFGDATSGLFLAAPRRTGKSTFLQSDLLPELESRDIVVVYCDPWADQNHDPASLIADAIGAELSKQLGFVARTAKTAGLESVNIAGWLKIDTTKIGTVQGTTLSDALKALHGLAKKPVELIIDEAQHALTCSQGEAAMTALKSARNQINRPGAINLMLIMSGSDRDKLLRLVNTTGAPFYGSTIQKMPGLGREFIQYVADLVEEQRPDAHPVDVDKLVSAFKVFSCRPQFFSTALGEVLNPLSPSTEPFEDRLLSAAVQRKLDDELQMAAAFLALKPLEKAALWRLLEQGSRFRAYDSDALNFYVATTSSAVTAQQVQYALESLRPQTPALVRKSARGEYAIDEEMMYRWFEKRSQSGTWPPIAPGRPVTPAAPHPKHLRRLARRDGRG